ncbi:phosphatidylinositol-glycan biosynthesis class S protein-domain-containing protein [Phlyctochytrium arcticum]|nr:phosphatidylinositol-glycan biosynthesis class S protein-domain-containing protein [Phlyctochytrium arcticum]
MHFQSSFELRRELPHRSGTVDDSRAMVETNTESSQSFGISHTGSKITLWTLDQMVNRRRVLCSILLFAVVGVPIWWKTTEVHRAPLDTVGIRKWAKQETCNYFSVSKEFTSMYAPEYHVTFSLLNAEPSETMVSWDIERAINTYIRPLFSKLSVISDFEVQSQVQNYADLPMTPEPINNNGHVEHLMRPTMLSHFINSAEWNLASAVSSAPPLNFIVYIPKKAFSPLFVAKSNGDHIATNSFLMPRWGGVLVQNQPESSSHHFTQEMLQPIMEVFVAQIRDLMGIKRVRLPLPDLDVPTRISVEYDSAPDVGLTDWELDTLVRTRTIQNLVDAIVTLQSLANLVEKLENMVVMDKIQKLVSNSLKSLDQASQALHDRNYTSASIHARAAIVSSEAAFFDPTMVSMLYFPDEHKYAVYMPFFIPVIVPVTLALIKELKGWKTQRSLSSKSKTE